MRPAPSRDIPLAMFVSARITILTITPVMIVTMVCSVTNYPPSHHNADTAALARNLGHEQKRGEKHLCTSNFSTCQFFNPTNLSSAVRVVPRNITVHSSPYFRSVEMWWCLFLRLCGWDIIDTPAPQLHWRDFCFVLSCLLHAWPGLMRQIRGILSVRQSDQSPTTSDYLKQIPNL